MICDPPAWRSQAPPVRCNSFFGRLLTGKSNQRCASRSRCRYQNVDSRGLQPENSSGYAQHQEDPNDSGGNPSPFAEIFAADAVPKAVVAESPADLSVCCVIVALKSFNQIGKISEQVFLLGFEVLAFVQRTVEVGSAISPDREQSFLVVEQGARLCLHEGEIASAVVVRQVGKSVSTCGHDLFQMVSACARDA